MFQLYASQDCGNTYPLDREAETLDELRLRMGALDIEGYCWYVEEDGEDCPEEMCAIHRDIFELMDKEVRNSELV